jgi:hypothetical protein
MSTVVARRILASPARLSSAVWQTITDLVTKGDSTATAEFAKVKGVASSLINDEVLKQHPFVVKNRGPRLRVYCLYGEDAVSGEDKNEEALSWSPTAESWHAFLPCLPDELDEMAELLAGKSKKFSVYDIEKGMPDDEPAAEEATAGQGEKTTVNWSSFGNL